VYSVYQNPCKGFVVACDRVLLWLVIAKVDAVCHTHGLFCFAVQSTGLHLVMSFVDLLRAQCPVGWSFRLCAAHGRKHTHAGCALCSHEVLLVQRCVLHPTHSLPCGA
jgi:hypothetical protein